MSTVTRSVNAASRFIIWLDDACVAPQIGGHVRQGCPLVRRQGVDDVSTEFEHLADTSPQPDHRIGEQVQHEVFRSHSRRQATVELNVENVRHNHADRARDEGIGHVRGADAECHAAYGTAVWRVRVGADNELPWEHVALRHHRVRDAFGPGVAGVSSG